MRVGACLSLSGRYARFGRQAAAGLRAWRRLSGAELVIEDDGSDPAQVAALLPRLAARSDVLLGPYSTQLMRAAGGFDGLLWNHGGAGDDVQASAPGRVVSVLAPASRYALPFVRLCAGRSERVPLCVASGRGAFGRAVAAGAAAAARSAGLDVAERPVPGCDVLVAGAFEDDVALVRELRPGARAVCSVAAGVRAFAEAVRDPEGVFGVAQWFPGAVAAPAIGPSQDAFVARLDYPGAQAAAAGVLATHCAQTAGTVEPRALWDAAAALDTTTFFGAFRIDPRSGAQLGHSTVLLRWRDGTLRPA